MKAASAVLFFKPFRVGSFKAVLELMTAKLGHILTVLDVVRALFLRGL